MSATYDKLVVERKSCRKCAGLTNPADPSHAVFDGDEVGPWSRWLASRPARLILVGQDWGTTGYFQDHKGRDLCDNKTNLRLTEFLGRLGFNVGQPDREDRQSGVFATNAILCLKEGRAQDMSAPVKQQWFTQCRPFLRRTIDESSATIVISLGVIAYQSVARAFGLNPRPFREAVDLGIPLDLDDRRKAFAVYHPAARPANRTLDQMRADWSRIREKVDFAALAHRVDL